MTVMTRKTGVTVITVMLGIALRLGWVTRVTKMTRLTGMSGVNA